MGRNKIAQSRPECRELGDAISANAVDADAFQRFPLIGFVRRPGDDSGADGMHARHEFLVDEGHVLPEILRARASKRNDRIDVTGDLEHAGPQSGEDAFHGFYNAVVERMHGAVPLMLADNPDHQRLDGCRLDLDIDHGVTSDCIEDSGERRNLDPVIESEIGEVGSAQVGDRTWWMIDCVNDRVVVDDYHSVAGGVDVQLDGLGANFYGAEKGRNRVLGQGLVGPAVGNLLGRGWAAGSVQAFPRVVALGTMSAKL